MTENLFIAGILVFQVYYIVIGLTAFPQLLLNGNSTYFV